ncbi:Neural proliferation differentiation and control protein 1 [Trichinella patagoniensis]|uniref:Neural proliferation differentiation and control protein 1 n=1 Tax=Trichinella patagoniensis TaxID=990121 RepID=A0A0V0ZE51_9BILA|nr:Neural proliferation differentiation and control protein 1 [Trichinella patagoniensis]
MRRKRNYSYVLVIILAVLVILEPINGRDSIYAPGSSGGRFELDTGELLAEEILERLNGDVDQQYISPTVVPCEACNNGIDVWAFSKWRCSHPEIEEKETTTIASNVDEIGDLKEDDALYIDSSSLDKNKLDPYNLVNIDRGQSGYINFQNPEVVTSSLRIAPTAVRESVLPAQRITNRKGQQEFDTFVNPPSSYRKKEVDRNVMEPMPQLVDKPKSVAGVDISDTVFYCKPFAIVDICTLALFLFLFCLHISSNSSSMFRGRCHGLNICGLFLYTVRNCDFLRKQYKESQFNEFPQLNGNGSKKIHSPNSVAAMDSKLASAAQLYHFQHTKQQIISMEHPSCDVKEVMSDDSEVEEDEGDYSVYECPGLAPTGNMEINNPLFIKNGGDVDSNCKEAVETNGQTVE